MHPFEQTVSVVGPLVGAIIVLTLFFRFLGWITRKAGPSVVQFSAKGVFDGNTPATVSLSSGETLENVRILGFTQTTGKADFPYELSRMVILQHDDGRHSLIQAKLIRRIDV